MLKDITKNELQKLKNELRYLQDSRRNQKRQFDKLILERMCYEVKLKRAVKEGDKDLIKKAQRDLKEARKNIQISEGKRDMIKEQTEYILERIYAILFPSTK